MGRGVVVAGVLVAAGPLVAQAVVLERVRVRSAPLRVELTTSGPVVPWVRRLPATGDVPHRIYIDLADTVIASGVRKVIAADAGSLVRVRAGQFTPTTARIVLDTTAPLAFDVGATDRLVTVGLGTADSSAAPPAMPPPGPPETSAASPTPPERVAAPADPPARRATEAPPPALPEPPAPAPPRPSPVARPEPSPAPPPLPAVASPPKDPEPPALPLIVVDAGHGGHDPGAEGIDGVQEKTITLQMAHRLAAKLPARLPVDSLLTRSDDSFVSLHERLPAGPRARTVFLSLHANACTDGDPRGVEIFFGSRHGSRAAVDSKHLARLITTELRARLLRVRGRPRHGPFRVLASNPAPSVLVEVGYLTHREDAARLQDARYQELFTDALVDAIAAFLQADRTTNVQAGHTLVPSDGKPGTPVTPKTS